MTLEVGESEEAKAAFEGICGRRTGHTKSWFGPVRESNSRCIYCNETFAPDGSDSDKEHLIGRKFCPKPNDGFNFIFRAHQHCNRLKSKYEGHVSAWTLYHSPRRTADPDVDMVALRKAASEFYPRGRGKTVATARSDFSVGVPTEFSGVGLTLGFTGPEPVSTEAVRAVACAHVQGLFALVTNQNYRDPTQLALLPPHDIWYFAHYVHNDWGNPQLMELARRVRDWRDHANVRCGGGYFRAILRQQREGLWFWALEWNACLRVVGGIAKTEAELAELCEGMPDAGWRRLSPSTRFREPTPASNEAPDELFRSVSFPWAGAPAEDAP